MEWESVDPAWIASVGAIASALFAAIALAINAYATWQAKLSRELQVFDRVYSNITRLEEKVHDLSVGSAEPDYKTRAAIAWRGSFLNAIEYLAFLINTGRYLQDPAFLDYISESVISW